MGENALLDAVDTHSACSEQVGCHKVTVQLQ